MMNRLRILIAAAVAALALIVAVQAFQRRICAAHQRGVIREIEAWSLEYTQIRDRNDAIRSAGMIDYISEYYVPSDRYRSDATTEQELHSARERALNEISDALSTFTGKVMADPLDWPAELCDNTRTIQDDE